MLHLLSRPQELVRDVTSRDAPWAIAGITASVPTAMWHLVIPSVLLPSLLSPCGTLSSPQKEAQCLWQPLCSPAPSAPGAAARFLSLWVCLDVPHDDCPAACGFDTWLLPKLCPSCHPRTDLPSWGHREQATRAPGAPPLFAEGSAQLLVSVPRSSSPGAVLMLPPALSPCPWPL